jgi:putative transposase
MIGFAAERLMQLEVGGLTGAAWGEKSPDRRVQRNGYRDRALGDAGGQGGTADPEAAQGQLLPGLP